MIPPLVGFLTWNRAGLTARNLLAILDSTDDFELHIVDNNSEDDTWQFIQSLTDERIKSKTRFELNRGQVYGLNYTLSKRKKEQFYIAVDNDVHLQTKDWISQFMETMQAFPEFGLVGAVREDFFTQKNISPTLLKQKDAQIFPYHVIITCCACIRPEVFELLGYWNEETHIADVDMCARINKFTPYKTGFHATIKLTQPQVPSCDGCPLYSECTLLKRHTTCYDVYTAKYKSGDFDQLTHDREQAFLEAIYSGKRSAFCASIHDPQSIVEHVYEARWAEENFQYFIDNAN